MSLKFKNRIKFCLIFLLSLLFIYILYRSIKSVYKSRDIYQIKNIENLSQQYDMKGFVILDEVVLDNFLGEDVKLESKYYGKLVRIENSFDTKVNELTLSMIKSLNLDTEKNHDYFYNNVLFNNVYENKYNFFSNINNSNKKEYETFLNSYIDQKSLVTFNTGYIINELDGYENLLDSKDFKNTSFSFINSNHSLEKLNGLKYVNNMKANVVLVLNSIKDFEKRRFNTINIDLDEVKYKAYLQDYKSDNGIYYLMYNVVDGIDKFIQNRFFSTKITVNIGQGYSIPNETIFELKGIKGVYVIKNGRVFFTPVKIIKEDEGIAYIHTDTPLFIEDNDFFKIREFDKILRNPRNYNIGDYY